MKKTLHNKTKWGFQSFIIGLILVLLILGKRGSDMEKFCPMGGLLSLGSKFWLGSMSCTMGAQQVFMGIALLVGVIIFSKLFCGYLCPIGTITEWLNKLYSKFGKTITLKGLLDRILRVGKYILLFFTAYYSITSSELFCKKFDPYYASVSGFDHDVVLWAGILTIIAVIFLSVIIRFFWCKYVCPLGAISNLFQNSIIIIPVILIFVLLRVTGVDLGIIWLILVLCIIGAAIEVFRFKFFTISPFKIKVNQNTCTSCGLCDKKCPQGIEVSKVETVTHPDCNLCLDCVKACETKDAISISNAKYNWIPPVAIIVLFALGMIASKQFSLTTLSERWDGYENVSNIKTFEMEGLKSVKCWGSSKSLQTKLMHYKGIHGLDTWVNQFKIKIYYDGDQLNENDIKKAMFKPSKYRLRSYKNEKIPESVSVFEVPVDGIFDTYDNYDLIYMLKKHSAICGMATNFGEPVNISVIFRTGELTPAEIRKIIEQDSYVKKTKAGEEVVKVNFECASEGKILTSMTYHEFIIDFFQGYDMKFNKYNEKDVTSLAIYEIGLPNADNSNLKRRLPYLTSHISQNDNIVRLRTKYIDRPVLQIFFVKDSVSQNDIYEKLISEKLTVSLRNGEIKDFDNPFSYEKPVKITMAEEK